MTEDRLITLAIHTYQYAVALKRILEDHGIEVKLDNIDIDSSNVNSGVRVRIKKSDLPLALKLTESGDGDSISKTVMKMTGVSGNLLIPVDFSPYSMLACRYGFQLAIRLDLHPVIMYAFTTPYFTGAMPFSQEFPDNYNADIPDVEAYLDVQKEAHRMMTAFKKKIGDAQAQGTLPSVKYSTVLNEGVPEDVILEYCRLTPPALVVMATRGKEKKEDELVGSVTAEVLDSCRVPLFVVPENCSYQSIESIRQIAYFCNLDQQDILSIDMLMRMFDYPDVDITLIPVNPRAKFEVKKKVDALCGYLSKNYPTAKFKTAVFKDNSFREEFEDFEKRSKLEMIIVPNKKKNVISRIFNPGIAHRLLFEKDMPLLALPV